MTWTPPHSNFTTFVKDDNNIYIKCDDGSWVVLTLSANPTGPFGGGGPMKEVYRYLEQKWSVIGVRAIPDETPSTILSGGVTELTVFGIGLLGQPSTEVRNAFELAGIVSDSKNSVLEIYGAKGSYLQKKHYLFGTKTENGQQNSPIVGKKFNELSYKQTEYIFKGTVSTPELYQTILNGQKAEDTNKIILGSGKTSNSMSFISAVNGSKTEITNAEIKLNGKKDFNKVLEVLLMEI